MLDKRTGETVEPTSEDESDMYVLLTILDEGDHWPWSVDELVREHGRGAKLAVRDSISRLERGGLIHRTTDDLVFPTRAAIYRARFGE
jgi:predicted transcriptional regulator